MIQSYTNDSYRIPKTRTKWGNNPRVGMGQWPQRSSHIVIQESLQVKRHRSWIVIIASNEVKKREEFSFPSCPHQRNSFSSITHHTINSSPPKTYHIKSLSYPIESIHAGSFSMAWLSELWWPTTLRDSRWRQDIWAMSMEKGLSVQRRISSYHLDLHRHGSDVFTPSIHIYIGCYVFFVIWVVCYKHSSNPLFVFICSSTFSK